MAQISLWCDSNGLRRGSNEGAAWLNKGAASLIYIYEHCSVVIKMLSFTKNTHFSSANRFLNVYLSSD